jgi:hypothetical protein
MEKRVLKAAYSGILVIGNASLFAYVLEDGTRILSATSVFTAFGRTRKGKRSQDERSYYKGALLPPFLPANLLKIQDNEENSELQLDKDTISAILGWAEEVTFYDGGTTKTGYKSRLLVEMCNLYIDARKNNYLKSSQAEAAKIAEILLQAFALVGLDGLIDEATGYNKDPKYQGLRVLVNQYIAEGLQKWTKTYPDKFFELLDRLYANEKTTSRNRPQYYGGFINTYIYEPLERGYVKKELDILNITDIGKRRARFNQWLSDYGKNMLILQLGQVMGLMQTSTNIRNFKGRFNRIDTITLFTDEQWEEIDG